MFYKEEHGHGKYVAGGMILGASLAVGVYYAVQYKLHEKAKALALDLVKQGYELTHPKKDGVGPKV